jgi:hypothetical protein
MSLASVIWFPPAHSRKLLVLVSPFPSASAHPGQGYQAHPVAWRFLSWNAKTAFPGVLDAFGGGRTRRSHMAVHQDQAENGA